MTSVARVLSVFVLAWLAGTLARAEKALEVRHAGPVGEVAELDLAREVRVVFSEPMVALGRVPEPAPAPFFRIEPAVSGRFRWSGTDTLIFTPDRPLAYATVYRVALDTSTTSVSGRRLAQEHAFSFTTPTLRLLKAMWYRKARRYDSPVMLALWFNQPVDPPALSRHISLQYPPGVAEAWLAPQLQPGAQARLSLADPAALADFEAKVRRTRAALRATRPLAYLTATLWDEKTFPREPGLVVLETRELPPTDAWIRVVVGPRAVGREGRQGPGKPQEATLRLEPTFFVDGPRCPAACDPELHNPIRFRGDLRVASLRQALRVSDVSEPGREAALTPTQPGEVEAGDAGEGGEAELGYGADYDHSSWISLEDGGYRLQPARTYAVRVDRGLTALDGQTLGYTWLGLVENWHQAAFTSFGSGHGVWEAGGGPQLPFYARNLQSVTQWAAPLALVELVPALGRLGSQGFGAAPPGPGVARSLAPVPDRIQSYGVDLAGVLSRQGTGLVWAALQDGPPIERTYRAAGTSAAQQATLVQVTNLGISVKDSPQNTLVFVTRLDTGAPVAGATVSIRTLDNAVFWTGPTDASGVALAPNSDLRNHEDLWQLRFVVTAEKDGDVAYAASDWHEGIEPWLFDARYDLDEAKPLLRGSVFADRGVYRLGEQVHCKAILRSDTTHGIALLPAGTEVEIVLRDSQGQELDKRRLRLGDWSSADWVLRLPEAGALGQYAVSAVVAGQQGSAHGSFLVAAYRRPEFRVDTSLAAEQPLAGAPLAGVVNARYLFGAPMAERDVLWTFTRRPLADVPRAIAERFPGERWAFLGRDWSGAHRPSLDHLRASSAALDAQGQLRLELETDVAAGIPYEYTLEGSVTDVSRQSLAGRAAFRIEAAPWYVGLQRPPFFVELQSGLDTEIVAVDLSGRPAAGVAVRVSLAQIQWHSVRRAEGQGYYAWETERRELPAGEWEITTAEAPAQLHLPLGSGGFFVLKATARDADGRSTTSYASFYVVGAGYTAWERYDHNRIDLVPERKSYRPGETARILVKSPWERATALLTTEREGIRSHSTFELRSTQQTVDVPIREEDIPNVYVSVLLVKGRSGDYAPEDASDPGKPAFRLGYVELEVEDAARRLSVSLSADREEYRPATQATVAVSVRDASGRGAAAEVTLWAVDYGVLSLTRHRTPDVLPSVYVAKALQVLSQDSRQRLISRRAIVPKGGEEGGGGGEEEGPGTPVRKDFRVLAFWLGALVTDAQGKASTKVTLPESLTTYRIMAVAADKASRFGWAEREIRTSKPVLLKAAFPRFLALGDTALFGSVVHSQLAEQGTAIVTLRSLDPGVLELTGDTRRTLEIGAKGSSEVRFEVRARSVGRARLQMSVSLLGEADAFEEVLPVKVLVSPETVAAYGQAKPAAREAVELPAAVVPGLGGLHLEMSSTALVGLGEGARYLVEYPYGCAEQRASAALGLMLAAELGDAFRLPDIEPGKLAQTAADTLHELEAFQCSDGGFAYWKGSCPASPYLTSYLLHVYQRGQQLGHAVKPSVLDQAYAYLEGVLGQPPPPDEGWWPSYTAWQAFAARVLARGGRNVDSHLTRLHGYVERMPVFALAYLWDAMQAGGETSDRSGELVRRLRNAILPEGGSAHVEELSDPHLPWFWSSNVRSTALTLSSLLRASPDDALAPGMVRWLLAARRNGRWGNTQENAVALEALLDYYKKYESEVPDFRAVVALGLDTLASADFRGRSSRTQTKDVPMPDLLGRGLAGERLDLAFEREGAGTLYYVARLQYADGTSELEAMDQGIEVEREYAPKQRLREDASRTFKAGELVEVRLTIRLTKERRFVAVSDPLPAGLEPVESWFATTAADLAREQREQENSQGWAELWQRGGFDHVERHDDRVLLFASRLSEGEHTFSYVARATTAGTFRTAPARAEEMYEPEVFGRTASDLVVIEP